MLINKEIEYLLSGLNEPRIVGKEFSQDVSFEWIQECKELKSLEKPVSLKNFEAEWRKRKTDVEFRVLFFNSFESAFFFPKK